MLMRGNFPPDNPVGHNWFAIGVNFPYIWTEGYDIGPNEILNHRTSTFGNTTISLLEEFRRMKRWGIDVVRMFAFERGEGITWRPEGNRALVRGIDSTFLQNIATVMSYARTAGVRIYWCLLQSADFQENRYQNQDPGTWQRMNLAFRYMLQNSGAGNLFIREVLCPFMDVVTSFRDTVFAIDLMNEPDGLWAAANCNVDEAFERTAIHLPAQLSTALRLFLRRYPAFRNENLRGQRNRKRLERRVISFLAEMARVVRGYNILVSAGFTYYNTFKRAENLNVLSPVFDFFDFHFYDVIDVANPDPYLPLWRDLGIQKPCIIGECGLGGQVIMDYIGLAFLGDTVLGHLGRAGPYFRRVLGREICQFPENTTLAILFSIQAEFIRYCFTTARTNGFGGCFIWEYGRQFRRVFELPRRLSERGNCPGNVRRNWEIGNCLMWMDRIPLLWKQHADQPHHPDMCVRRSANELCGRPTVRKIEHFRADLGSQGLLPNWQPTGTP